MMIQTLKISSHASKRMGQRAISDRMVECVLDFGEVFHRQGCFMYFLADRNIVKGYDFEVIQAARGLVVITSSAGVVITSYHNRKSGLKDLKRKDKVNRKSHRIAEARNSPSQNTYAYAA